MENENSAFFDLNSFMSSHFDNCILQEPNILNSNCSTLLEVIITNMTKQIKQNQQINYSSPYLHHLYWIFCLEKTGVKQYIALDWHVDGQISAAEQLSVVVCLI